MRRLGINLLLAIGLAVSVAAAVTLGEVGLSVAQYQQALTHPTDPAGQILWDIRAPRVFAAAAVGACLGLSGALLQGLLRNPLADPGVLGVSACAGLGASLAIVLGLAVTPGAVEGAALAGAGVAAVALVIFATRFAEPEALILFGVSLSAFAGALTALVFNFSPSPIATAEVLGWMLGSVRTANGPTPAGAVWRWSPQALWACGRAKACWS